MADRQLVGLAALRNHGFRRESDLGELMANGLLQGEWWARPEVRGELDAVLSLLAEARRALLLDEERAARKSFDALNRAWNAFRRLSPESAESDWQALKALFSHGLPLDGARDFARCRELAKLSSIEPPILDHSVLLRRDVLGSMEEIAPDVRNEARAKHIKLRRALVALANTDEDDAILRSLVRTADLLYVIRSNLMHGEKFAEPDPRRRARDRVVAKAASATLDEFFDALFKRPSTRLAAYGSLRPQSENAGILAEITGSWDHGVIRGRVDRSGPFPILTWDPGGGAVDVEVLTSPELPLHWERIDAFEGNRYQRVLVAVEGIDSEVVVANAYIARPR